MAQLAIVQPPIETQAACHQGQAAADRVIDAHQTDAGDHQRGTEQPGSVASVAGEEAGGAAHSGLAVVR